MPSDADDIAARDAHPVTGWRRGVGRLLGVLDAVTGAVATLALIALVVIVFANVVGRYGFSASITWANEAAIWLFVSIIFLAVPLAHRARTHLSIQFLVDRLPPTGRLCAGVLSDTLVVYGTVLLLTGATTLIQMVGGVNYVLGLPSWFKFAVIPASAALGLIYLLLRGVEAGEPVWRGPLAVSAGILLYYALHVAGWIALDGFDPAWLMIVSFLAAMVIGTPVAFAMIVSAFLATTVGGSLPPAAVVQNMVNGSSKFLLLAIPFFITAGALMNAGGLTRKLIDFAFRLVGHLRGGLAQVNVVSSGLYAGISGSSYSEAALGSKLLVPQMVRHGYAPGFACAVTAASATLPNVIPPSIALLILASVANLSVGSLWLAGVGPGLLMGACLMGCVYWISRRRGYDVATERASWRERGQAFRESLPVLGLAAVILIGIRGGIVTPTEAGVLAVVYAFILGVGVYRSVTLKEMRETLGGAARETAMVGLLIGAAAPFTFVLVTNQVPQEMTAAITALSENPLIVLLLCNLVLLFFGMFLDIGAAILILTPLLMPVAVEMGVDPIHFGLIVVVNLMLGGLTPPVGMLAFITSTVTKTPVHHVFHSMYPLLGALLVALLIVTYVPLVSLGLGQIFKGV